MAGGRWLVCPSCKTKETVPDGIVDIGACPQCGSRLRHLQSGAGQPLAYFAVTDSAASSAGDFMWLGEFLVGPHPITKEPHRWIYTNTIPPLPLSAGDNEWAEKIAAGILNRPDERVAP